MTINLTELERLAREVKTSDFGAIGPQTNVDLLAALRPSVVLALIRCARAVKAWCDWHDQAYSDNACLRPMSRPVRELRDIARDFEL